MGTTHPCNACNRSSDVLGLNLQEHSEVHSDKAKSLSTHLNVAIVGGVVFVIVGIIAILLPFIDLGPLVMITVIIDTALFLTFGARVLDSPGIIEHKAAAKSLKRRYEDEMLRSV